MSDSSREIHLERLLGTRVRDVNGEVVGRLEEVCCENVDGELVVVEYHIGPAAVLERMGVFVAALPLLDRLPWSHREYRVRWQDVELVDSRTMRLRVGKDEVANPATRRLGDSARKWVTK